MIWLLLAAAWFALALGLALVIGKGIRRADECAHERPLPAAPRPRAAGRGAHVA